jgi:amidase
LSAVNGQTLNPYGPGVFDPSGSSTGSGVSVAANLAAVAVGTETLGSIISPSGWNSAVGIRPTLGLVSRDGIIPITHSQDTAGPIGRSVTDVAVLLGTLAGVDRNDPVTAASEGQIPVNYTQFLNANGLQGKRIGVVRRPLLEPDFLTLHPLPVVENALVDMKRLGATLVEDLDMSANISSLFELWGDNPPGILMYEFQTAIEKYFASLGEKAPVKTLEELIAFNAAHAEEAIPLGQDLFELSLEFGDRLGSPEYLRQLNEGLRLMGKDGFDALLQANNLDALVFTEAWASLGAIPGYPSISVRPATMTRGIRFRLSFWRVPTPSRS